MKAYLILALCIKYSLFNLAQATTFFQRPFSETLSDAPLVVRGIVQNNRADWVETEDGGRKLFTFTEVQVDEVLKGSASTGLMVVREIGGEKDGIGMKIAGTAEFKRSEEVVVFLHDTRNSDGTYSVKGMMMSKLQVLREKGEVLLEGPALLEPSHSGVLGAEPEGHSGTEHGHESAKSQKMNLERLRLLISEQANPSPQKVEKSDAKSVANPTGNQSSLTTRDSPAMSPSNTALAPDQNLQPLDSGGGGTGVVNLVNGLTVLAFVSALSLLGWWIFKFTKYKK
jgi:hypothetical protein